ncbi:helix-turn-helix transcriptional regulator [Mesorhizobium xinjiangense]|uniref:helix-turn-helix transcriptional regulator n=1 Tax=Mesorhizobium xinjiangense TaxID=2678685 RepID=UPI0018DCD2A9|nr:helix-turn-helix transcriptional regulator [Mesorhizobium xinjiangense]
MAVLPRAELDALQEALASTRDLTAYEAGRLPGLSPEEALEYANAASPLAFWRKYRGFTQAALAEQVGIAQNYLSDIENGKRDGPVSLWLKLAAALGLPLEVLVDEED